MEINMRKTIIFLPLRGIFSPPSARPYSHFTILTGLGQEEEGNAISESYGKISYNGNRRDMRL